MSLRLALLLLVAALATASAAVVPPCTAKGTCLLGPRKLVTEYGEDNPGRVCSQYARAIAKARAAGNLGRARALAFEAKGLFVDPVASYSAGLPRALDRPARLRDGSVYGDFYSATLGCGDLMLEFLRVWRAARGAALAPYGAASQLADAAQRFADAMIAHGTDRYGARDSDDFACLLAFGRGRRPLLPGVMFGANAQGPVNFPRVYGDLNGGGAHRFCYRGGNLEASQAVVYLMWDLAEAGRGARYAAAGNAAVAAWARTAAAPESGLYAWGEHAQYDFFDDAWWRGPSAGNDYWAAAYRLHERSSLERSAEVYRRMLAAAPAAFKRYGLAIFAAHVTNLTNPWAMAYDRHGALWAPARPRSPSGLNHMLALPRHVDMWFEVWGRLLMYTEDAAYRAALISRWVAFVEGLKALRVRTGLRSVEVHAPLLRGGAIDKDGDIERPYTKDDPQLASAARKWAARLGDRAAATKDAALLKLAWRLKTLGAGSATVYRGEQNVVWPRPAWA